MIGDGDLDLIFESGDFDTDAVFTISTGVTLTVKGWLTSGTQQANQFTNEIEVINPMFDCETDAVATVRKGMSVVIDGGTYTVERKQDNGTGVTTLHLKS